MTVELVSAEGPREVVGGTGALSLRATGTLDPERAGLVLVPGAAGRVGGPGEMPDHDAGRGRGSGSRTNSSPCCRAAP